MTRRLALASLVLVVAGCGRGGDAGAADGAARRDGPGPVSLGAPAPAYASTTLGGDTTSLAAQRGKVVLLNIWATWCHPCRQEIPVLEQIHARFAPRGFEVVGVSVDAEGEQDKIRSFASDMKMTYPIWLDPDERVSQTFLAVGVPATYLIDREGMLRWRKVGPISEGDSTLVREIERALQ